MASPEIQELIQRLRLSPGDVLGLAREVAQDSTLRSVDHLTSLQHRHLIDLLEFLGAPSFPTRSWESEWIGKAS